MKINILILIFLTFVKSLPTNKTSDPSVSVPSIQSSFQINDYSSKSFTDSTSTNPKSEVKDKALVGESVQNINNQKESYLTVEESNVINQIKSSKEPQQIKETLNNPIIQENDSKKSDLNTPASISYSSETKVVVNTEDNKYSSIDTTTAAGKPSVNSDSKNKTEIISSNTNDVTHSSSSIPNLTLNDIDSQSNKSTIIEEPHAQMSNGNKSLNINPQNDDTNDGQNTKVTNENTSLNINSQNDINRQNTQTTNEKPALNLDNQNDNPNDEQNTQITDEKISLNLNPQIPNENINPEMQSDTVFDTYDEQSDRGYPGSMNDEKDEIKNKPSTSDFNVVEEIDYHKVALDNTQKIYQNGVMQSGNFEDDKDSHFFAYFLTVMITAVVFYLVFHNKQKIIALTIEGRNGRSRRRGSTRAKYHKLDNNLEEAISSNKSRGFGLLN